MLYENSKRVTVRGVVPFSYILPPRYVVRKCMKIIIYWKTERTIITIFSYRYKVYDIKPWVCSHKIDLGVLHPYFVLFSYTGPDSLLASLKDKKFSCILSGISLKSVRSFIQSLLESGVSRKSSILNNSNKRNEITKFILINENNVNIVRNCLNWRKYFYIKQFIINKNSNL